VTALGLRSPPISSIIADVKNARSNQGQQHRCLPKVSAPSAGPATSTAFDDLIHLPGPLTEDAVLKCLQARFCAKQYHVRSMLLRKTDRFSHAGSGDSITLRRNDWNDFLKISAESAFLRACVNYPPENPQDAEDRNGVGV